MITESPKLLYDRSAACRDNHPRISRHFKLLPWVLRSWSQIENVNELRNGIVGFSGTLLEHFLNYISNLVLKEVVGKKYKKCI